MNRGVKLPCGSQSVGKSPAHWFNLYISVINVYCSFKPGDYWNIFFCLCFVISTCSLFFFTMGEVNPVEFGIMNAEHNFGLSRDIPWLQNSIPGSPGECPSTFSCCCVFILFFFFNFFKFFCSVPLLSAQAGSHCGIIHNFNPFCYVNVLHSLNLRCTFVWNFNVLTFWSRIVRTQFTGNHHLLRQKDSYLRCY